MAKLNRTRPEEKKIEVAGSPISTNPTPSLITHEGATAYERTAKSELFIMAVSNFFGEDTFYEKGQERNARFIQLVRSVAIEDPEWFVGFVNWLRNDAYIRTASIVAAAEGADALLKEGVGGWSRKLVASALSRADEPGEFIAYWRNNVRPSLPSGVQRGLADAVGIMYGEAQYLKWDSDRASYHFADVIELSHPKPDTTHKSALYKYILDKRHNHADEIPENLQMLRRRAEVLAIPEGERRQWLRDHKDTWLGAYGFTWENMSSWVPGGMDAEVWERMIPSMKLMAIARNLRNFDQAGISKESSAEVVKRLQDVGNIRGSKILPFQLYSAYKNTNSLVYAAALERGLNLTLQNIPTMNGKTLVLIDTSASMTARMSARSDIQLMEAGAVFGIALALKQEGNADVFGFANYAFEHKVVKGASLLREVEKFIRREGEAGHGTQIASSLRKVFQPGVHQRVVIVTDMQTFGNKSSSSSIHGWGVGDVSSAIPADVPIYAFNLGGYKPAMMESGSTRHELGGLTDATFAMIPRIEQGQRANWPWLENK